MSSIPFLTEATVESLLDWDELVPVVEQVMVDVSAPEGEGAPPAIQPARGFLRVPQKAGALLTMPAFLDRNQVMACKLVTAFANNTPVHGLPSTLATVAVFHPDTGQLRALLEATALTEWRTAAASVVAARHLKPGLQPRSLAVLGAGRQARAHILALHHAFRFPKVHLWNRSLERAQSLAKELKLSHDIEVTVFGEVKPATEDADVVVTATFAQRPILRLAEVKEGVLILAVGAGLTHHSELHPDIYGSSAIFTDHMTGARSELQGLEEQGFHVLGEVGQVVTGRAVVPQAPVVVFQSLGMAAEDAAAAKLVLDKHLTSSPAATNT